MKLKRLKATFGTLNGAELSFGPGLNVITAPNETGKTTWCAFLRSMLYGVSTSDREKAGYLPDKKKYMPWSGEKMHGAMDFTKDGEELSLARISYGSTPMQKAMCVRTGTSEHVPELEGAGAGELLTGVSEAVFTRTAFIGENGPAVTAAPELERKVSAIVTTGSDASTYLETDKRLRDWRNALDNGRGKGSIPKNRAMLKEQEDRLGELEHRSGELRELRQNVEHLEDQIRRLEGDLEVHRELEARESVLRVIEAKKTAAQAEEHAEFIRSSLRYKGRLLTAADIAQVRGAYAAFEATGSAYLSAKALSEEADTLYSSALEDKSKYTFADFSPEEAASAAKRVEELIPLVKEESERKRRPYLPFLPLILPFAAILLALFFPTLPVLIGCGVGFIAGIALFLWLRNRKPATPFTDELHSILNGYGYPKEDVFLRDAATFSAACEREATLRAASEDAKRRMNDARETVRSVGGEALTKAQALDPAVRELAAVPGLLDRLEQLRVTLQEAETEAAVKKSAFETLRDEYGRDPSEDELPFLVRPLRSKEDTEAAILRARDKLTDVRQRLALTEGASRVSGDPAVISGEIGRLSAAIDEDKKKIEALDLAASVLRDASSEMQSRVSPLLGKLASEYMSRLTDGKYDTLAFDKTFSALATEKGSDIGHDPLCLSEGTVDQLYLSLRLAMCELILGGEDPCPIVLDDPLMTFDDARAEAAIRLLGDLAAGGRQILLFTCRGREADYAACVPGSRVIAIGANP